MAGDAGLITDVAVVSRKLPGAVLDWALLEGTSDRTTISNVPTACARRNEPRYGPTTDFMPHTDQLFCIRSHWLVGSITLVKQDVSRALHTNVVSHRRKALRRTRRNQNGIEGSDWLGYAHLPIPAIDSVAYNCHLLTIASLSNLQSLFCPNLLALSNISRSPGPRRFSRRCVICCSKRRITSSRFSLLVSAMSRHME